MAQFSRMSNFDLLKCSAIPCQEDEWSCGLRACMCVRYLLQKGVGAFGPGGWLTPIEDFVIEDMVLNDQAVADYCSGWTQRTASFPIQAKDDIPLFSSSQSTRVVPTPARSLRAKFESQAALPSAKPLPAAPVASQLKPEPATLGALSQPTPAPVAPAKPLTAAPVAKQLKPEPATLGALSQPTPAPVAPAKPLTAAPVATELEPEPATFSMVAPIPSPDEPSPPSSMVSSPPEALDEQIAALLAQRPAAQTRRRDVKTAKRILAEANFTFNHDFQKAHTMRPQKGHWEHFLKAVLATYHKTNTECGLECVICRKLLHAFDIPAVAERVRSKISMEGNSSASSAQPQEPSTEAGMEMVLHDSEEAAVQPNKRAKRGRPCKEDPVTFNLIEFIATERAGQYEFLTREKAGLDIAKLF